MTLFAILDYSSVLVFAATGALVASRAQLDIIGFVFLASLTAVGGGTLRDVLLDRNPVFWIADPTYLFVAAATAVIVFFTAHMLESRYTVLEWLDAAALSFAVAAGSGIAVAVDAPATIVVVMGVITGCMGGLARDVVANEVPLVLKQGQLYVTCAFVGALGTSVSTQLGASALIAALVCGASTFVLRAGSIRFGWSLPVYKSRPPRQ
ncbi:MAG: trimeric intracellular cation channel family protein [Pseudomonadota bacterium]|nr:trimeric intracellular cation channel family protein [Pseudomonadota bacterium]MEC8579690.1 trimeric intracellular cation channel family protein [Pseudomonadota bacterium]MEE3360080.1 trimeric intracellular cation channel family protein [Pseudomonadota bacterium]